MAGRLLDSRDIARLRPLVRAFEHGLLNPGESGEWARQPEQRPPLMAWLLEQLAPEPASAPAVIAQPTRQQAYMLRALSEVDPEEPREIHVSFNLVTTTFPERATAEEVQEIIDDLVASDGIPEIRVQGLGTRYGNSTWSAPSWFFVFPPPTDVNWNMQITNTDDSAQVRRLRTIWIPSTEPITVFPGFPISEPIRAGLRVECRHQPSLGFVALLAEWDE